SFVDYDHDGDLDLYVTAFAPFHVKDGHIELSPDSRSTGNSLWRNNGNGTFTSVTAETGVAGEHPSLGVVASDLNNDRAVDFVVTNWQSAPVVYSNPRDGHFSAS